MKRLTVSVLATMAALLLIGGTASASAAEPESDEDQLIRAMLAEVPGGIVVDETHVVWPRLDMELIVRPHTAAFARTVGTCATGRICAYNALSLGGSALTFSACSTHTVPSSFSAKSLANARTSGYVEGRSGSTVVATVYAGSWANVPGGLTTIRCYL